MLRKLSIYNRKHKVQSGCAEWNVGLHLTIVCSINRLVFWSIKYQKFGFTKPKIRSSDVLFYPPTQTYSLSKICIMSE